MNGSLGKLLDLMGARERWKLAFLLLGMILLGLIEMLGVASIMPFMAVVAKPSIIFENQWLHSIYVRLGFEDTWPMLITLGLVALGALLLRNALTAGMNWALLRFTWGMNHRLSGMLLSQYMSRPYWFHLNRNTSGLGMNILSEVQTVTSGLLRPLLNVVASGVTATCIVVLLLYTDVVLALATTLAFGGLYGIAYLLSRRRLTTIGRERIAANRGRYKTANEALGGIKEIMAAGREAEFKRRFSLHSREFSARMTSLQIIGTFPRYVLDTVAFGTIILIVLYLLSTREGLSEVLSVLTLFAFAGYRLAPDLQQIYTGYANLRSHRPALEILHHDIRERLRAQPATAATKPKPLDVREAIELKSITYTYPGSPEMVLSGVDIRIPAGKTVALVGPTGSGKTTLVDILLGLLEPELGDLSVDGSRITWENLGRWRAALGYVPQVIYLCDDTIRRNISFGIPEKAIDDGAVERAARLAHLHDFVLSLENRYETIVGERGVRLSGGQRQRIGIARALYHDPAVLILDEATSALDNITERDVMRSIRDLTDSKTIVLVAHRLSTVCEADVIYLLEEGRVVAAGTYEELRRANPRFREMARLGLVAGARTGAEIGGDPYA
ncbi:ABC transporter ATP-binding protein [soil metagenome]